MLEGRKPVTIVDIPGHERIRDQILAKYSGIYAQKTSARKLQVKIFFILKTGELENIFFHWIYKNLWLRIVY